MLAENEKHSLFCSQYMCNMCSDPIRLVHYSPVMPMDQLRAEKIVKSHMQDSYPFSEKNFQDFSRTQIDVLRTLKFTLPFHSQDLYVNFPYCLPCISYFLLSLTDFQNLSRPVAFFQDFPGFPGPAQTLDICILKNLLTLKMFGLYEKISNLVLVILMSLSLSEYGMVLG